MEFLIVLGTVISFVVAAGLILLLIFSLMDPYSHAKGSDYAWGFAMFIAACVLTWAGGTYINALDKAEQAKLDLQQSKICELIPDAQWIADSRICVLDGKTLQL